MGWKEITGEQRKRPHFESLALILYDQRIDLDEVAMVVLLGQLRLRRMQLQS